MEKKTIGSFIAILRKSNGMTQQGLADRLNVSNKTVSKWECDDGYPELTLIPVIAEIFNVSSDEILQGCKISKNEQVEKSSVKTDKQLSRLISSTTYRFKAMSLTSVALSICGFILLFVIAYGTFRPYIGLGILVLFLMASFVLEILNFFSTKSALNASELLDEEDKRIIDCDVLINKYFFYLIMLNIIFLVIGLPIGLMGDAYSVVTFTYFLNNVLPYLIVYMVPFCLLSYVIYQIKDQGRLKFKIESNIKTKSNLKKLNISFGFISILLLFIFFVLPIIVYTRNINQNDNSYTHMEGPVLYVFPLLFSPLCICYASLRKKILKRL